MAKIVKTFQEGKMNKDLDERLIPNGEYRDAMNIEVSTSDGSDAGVVQFVRGNKRVKSYNEVVDPLLVTTNERGTSSVVGSVSDDKNNDAYFFIASPWHLSSRLEKSEPGKPMVYKDMIIRYSSTSKKLHPLVTDIWRVISNHTFRGRFDTSTNISSDFNHVLVDGDFDTRLLRPGMIAYAVDAQGNNVLEKVGNYDDGDGMESGVKIREITEDAIYFDRTINHKIRNNTSSLISSVIDKWIFTHPEPVLQFAEGRNKIESKDPKYSDIKNYVITGVNIIDNFLLWTDGCSEPKKINLDRFLEVKNNNQPSFSKHSFNLLSDPYSEDPDRLKTLKEIEDPTNIGLGVDNSLTRDHITVIKKAPRTAPKLIMSNSLTSIDGVTSIANCNHDFKNVYEGDAVEGVSVSQGFAEGSILVFTPKNNIYVSVRALVLEVNDDNIYTLEIEGISTRITNASLGEYSDYKVQLVQTNPIFRDKLGRFSYRYKYYDNECSTFAPWSELAFIPSAYDYTPVKGYNLGMSNNLRSLKVTDFVNNYASRPDDVKEIDILFKDTTSPNVYIIKTIKRGKNFEWHDRLGGTTGFKGGGAKGVVSITTDMVHRTLEESQSLRSWDNVPKYAKAQEVTGSRVVYANYNQGYDVFKNVTVNARTISEAHPGSYDEVSYLAPYKSVKSMRKYKLGVVFGDKYGRETPVLGIGGNYENDFYIDPLTLESDSNPNTYIPESFNVTKDKCAGVTRIKAQLNWEDEPQDWMDYYKFYIKETSNEYYSLVMDRWYDNGDGTIWMSFSSADRNKITFEKFAEDRKRDDTYLILKKGQNSQTPVLNEDARYKVLAVSNEAPDFIKTVDKIKGVEALDMTGTPDISGLLTVELDAVKGSLDSNISLSRFQGVGWARIKGVSSGSTPSEILYSEWRRLTNINFTTGTVSVNEPWGDKANMASDYGFGDGASIDYFVEIKDSVVENKPEFNGRFFVKIYKDNLLEQTVITQNSSNLVYSAELVSDVGYIYTGANVNNRFNPADPGAIFQGDYSDVDAPTPTNSSNNYTGSQWGYTGHDRVPAMYEIGKDGCGKLNLEGYPEYDYNIIKDFWEDYYFGSAYGSSSANRWFIDHASYVKEVGTRKGEWTEGFMQGVYHTSEEEFLQLMNIDGFFGSSLNINIPGNAQANITSGVVPENKNTIAFSKVGGSIDGSSAAFKNKMTTVGQKFRFKSDPGLNGDPIVYEVFASISEIERRNYKGVGSYSANNIGENYCQGCVSELVDGVGYDSNCIRQGFVTFFKQASNEYQGLDTSIWDPRSSVKHDGSNSLKIEILTPADTSQYPTTTVSNVDNAIWETEPKEDIGLDLYYEASDALPLRLNNNTIEDYIPLYSAVTAYSNHLQQAGSVNYSSSYANQPDELYVSSVVRDVVGLGYTPGSITPIPIRINDRLEFKRLDGTVTEGFVKDYWQPIRKSSNTFLQNSNSTVVAVYEPATRYSYVEMALEVTGGGRTLSIPMNASDGTLQSGIIGDLISGFSNSSEIWRINNIVSDVISLIGDTYIYDRASTSNIGAGGLTILSAIIDESSIQIEDKSNLVGGFDHINETPERLLFRVDLQRVTGYYRLEHKVHENCIILPWFNCYSFGNGLESNRINDDFNAPYINNGFKVSTTLDSYGEENKTNGLIYSGVYNSIGGINKLNEFNASESITKDINPSYGPIRALKSRDTNLVTFCEDKVLQILANKDSLFNADGSSNLISSNKVLGNTKAFSGDYGIGNSPESLAVDGYRMYFIDNHRNKALRLSQDGLTIISDIGMKKFFRENLENSKSIVGSFDDVKGDYNITINYKQPQRTSKTVSFNERNKGWTSFKSFIPENGISINSDYLTAKRGEVYLHHVARDTRLDNAGNIIGPNPGEFYGNKTNSSIEMIFNESPNVIKSFKAISYEGTRPRVEEFSTASVVNANGISISNQGLNSQVSDGEFDNLKAENGWFVTSIETDLESGNPVQFKNKEGKWFSNLMGVQLDRENLNIDQVQSQNFTIQGIGRAKDYSSDVVEGCTCPDSLNYNPLAQQDDGSCDNTGVVYGCTDSSYVQYDASATHRKTSCTDPSDPCLSLHVFGCNVELNQAGNRVDGVAAYADGFVATNNNNLVTKDDGSCVAQVLGCTDASSISYNPAANTDDGSCNPVVLPACIDPDAYNYDPSAVGLIETSAVGFNLTGFYGNPCIYKGCSDHLALNSMFIVNGIEYTQSAFQSAKGVHHLNVETGQNVHYKVLDENIIDDGSCEYPVTGCMDPNALNYNPLATIDDGSCEYQDQFDITIDEI